MFFIGWKKGSTPPPVAREAERETSKKWKAKTGV